ncbi:hypothetical protein NDU88_005755 [Pleurodeles waltl]|uniref:Uncharacterized protein n=1 Tax=Pleurodeles waltl TaxID=8319 RepID=A0AAV7RPW6_PLEWA|nr:hypothetical protein NDU88_005755 [Pleurodeles waltl]
MQALLHLLVGVEQGQARQLLTAARSKGPFKGNSYEIRISADFSKETNEHLKAFLSLRPGLRQLEVKYGIFELAHIWVTKNGQSKDFYDPEDLRLYLDDLSTTLMDLTPQNMPADVTKDFLVALLPLIPLEGRPVGARKTHQRGRDLVRLSRPHDDRDKVLLAVEHYTQQMDRDNSCSPLKPVPTST